MNMIIFEIIIGVIQIVMLTGAIIFIKAYYGYKDEILTIKSNEVSKMRLEVDRGFNKLEKSENKILERTKELLKAEAMVKVDIKAVSKERKNIENFYSEDSVVMRLAKQKSFDYIKTIGVTDVSDIFMAHLFESFIDDAEAEIKDNIFTTVSKRTIDNYKNIL